MLRSFPDVRIGLMFSVGGGAPSQKHDIRLGDIVVSAPLNGCGSLFEYDFGKTIQNQKFQNMCFLNQPPSLLRAAMADIEAHLLDRGADVNIPGGYYGNALQAASSRGHKQIVELLLDRGANFTFKVDVMGMR